MTKRGRVHRVDLNESNRRPQGMARITMEALLLAIDLGWDATEMRNGMVQLINHHEGNLITINLPTNQRSIKQAVSDSWFRKLMRYSNPMKIAFLNGIREDVESDDELQQKRGVRNFDTLKSAEILDDPGKLRLYMHQENEPEPEPDPVEVVEVVEQPAQVEQPTDEPHITKIKPWIAKHHMGAKGGEVYESKAVLERKWTDGTTDYVCTQCDYARPEARSVSSHYSGKHRDQPATQSEAEMFIDPAIRWTPTERQAGRIARLAKEMIAAWQELGPDMDAHECAAWIVKKRDAERDTLTDDVSPLTPEQVIERVRKLVDGGAYADLLARMEQVEAKAQAKVAEMEAKMSQHDIGATNALKALRARMTELEATCQEGQAEVERARESEKEAHDRWQALVELVNTPG